MKIFPNPSARRAFTLIELLFSISVGLVVAGAVVYLLFQTATEQRLGLVNTTVEEKAYVLQANLISCLRAVSVNQGIQPNYSDTNAAGGYQSIFVFTPTTNSAYMSGYVRGFIQFTPASGQVVYTPDVTAPAVQSMWMSNSATCRLTNFQFTTSVNLDGSQNNSLVNVSFTMDDNFFSQRSPTNNPARVWRNFSVQMRND